MKRAAMMMWLMVLAVECFGQAAYEIRSPEQVLEIPALNRMVWISAPKAKSPPVLDGTLKLEEGEWSDAPAVYGMMGSTDMKLMPLYML